MLLEGGDVDDIPVLSHKDLDTVIHLTSLELLSFV